MRAQQTPLFNKADIEARIATASGIGLTIITYELALSYIEQAKAAYGENIDDFRVFVQRAQKCVDSLIGTLDFSVAMSRKELLPLYVFVNKQLTDAYFGKTDAPLADAVLVLKRLLSGWEAAAAQEPAAVSADTQQVFVTYKNGGLSEHIVQDETRGFQV